MTDHTFPSLPPARQRTSLTWAQVERIRSADPSLTVGQVARLHGISHGRAAAILDGFAFKVHGFTPTPRPRTPRTKLNWPQVREIRRRLAEGEKQVALAREFGVSTVAIHFIAHREHWKYDPADGDLPDTLPPRTFGMLRLDWDKVREMRRLYAVEGVSMARLAVRFEVSEPTVWHVIRGKTWKE